MVDDNLIDWLLASNIPTIRFLTLSDLLGLAADDPAVVSARQAIATEGPVPQFYERQLADGCWGNARHYYSPKYRSTHWTMLLLDELSADGGNEQYRRGADYMLSAISDRMAHRQSSGEFGWSCLFANVLHYAVRAGFIEDPRLQDILRYVETDLGLRRCACAYNDGERCGWGVARSLWAAAAVPSDHRTPELQAAIDAGVSFLLEEFALHEANYPTGDGKPHSLWYRLNFPLFYQSDILFALRALADAGALDHPHAQPALDWLMSKRGKDGRWRGSSPFRKRTWAAMGGPEETDRWVSLQSATLLRMASMLD